MPTDRPRYVITETEPVQRALDAAVRRWPEEASRSKLLVRLVEEGHRAIAGVRDRDIAARRAAITATAGALTGVYGPGYLEELRGDWPE